MWAFRVFFGSWLLLACASSTANVAGQDPASTDNAPPAASAAPAASANQNHFFDEGAGISIDKQPDWAFMPFEAELANRKAVSVGKEETDKAMHDSTTPPLVVIARYPEPSEKPNPTLKINWRLLGDLEGKSPLDIGRVVAELMAKLIPSFVIDSEVSAAKVGGLDAATFRAHFTIEVPHLGRAFPVTTQAWIVPRRNHGLIIVASDPSGGAENHEADFQAMVKSIVIQK